LTPRRIIDSQNPSRVAHVYTGVYTLRYGNDNGNDITLVVYTLLRYDKKGRRGSRSTIINRVGACLRFWRSAAQRREGQQQEGNRLGCRARGAGESPAQKHVVVCADRLATKRTARTSGVYIGALTTRTCQLQSKVQPVVPAAPIRGPKKDSCRPLALAPKLSNRNGWGS